MVGIVEKKESNLEAEHNKKGMEIWVLSSNECLVIGSKDLAHFDFDPNSNLKLLIPLPSRVIIDKSCNLKYTYK